MKKLLLALALVPTLSFGQWVNKTVNNDFDPAYRISYNPSTRDDSFLKLEDFDGDLLFYIQNIYTCTDAPVVDVVFIFSDGSKQNYSLDCITSTDRRVVFISPDILSEPFLNYFKRATKIKLRINDIGCESESFEFNMSGSTSAINFMLHE
jgi:hypothetical protein